MKCTKSVNKRFLTTHSKNYLAVAVVGGSVSLLGLCWHPLWEMIMLTNTMAPLQRSQSLPRHKLQSRKEIQPHGQKWWAWSSLGWGQVRESLPGAFGRKPVIAPLVCFFKASALALIGLSLCSGSPTDLCRIMWFIGLPGHFFSAVAFGSVQS